MNKTKTQNIFLTKKIIILTFLTHSLTLNNNIIITKKNN